MHKVYSGYFIEDPRKFPSIEAATRELNRLKSLCYRLRNKQTEEIHFLLGVSVTDSEYCGWGFGEIGFDKPMNMGGKKQFICSGKVRKIDHDTGEVIRVTPPYDTEPHIHLMVYGYGASSCAQHILTNLWKANKGGYFQKVRLESAERIEGKIKYIENQCSKLWEVN
ncbi:MAG: hypothetical protein GX625_14295 [Clostridiaceae bacterium]|nr:hypothetical protein [Clostridiaceae bacterium]